MKDMQAFVKLLTDQLSFGDALSMVQIFQARGDQIREFRDSIPALRVAGRPLRREAVTQSALRDAFSRQGRRLTDTVGMKAVSTTDIFGFLRRASSYSRAGGGRKSVVIVLSDMLQSVPGMDFERNGNVPDASWIERQRQEGLLPSLQGACLVAVGVEEGTPRAVKVRKFWLQYAKAVGATLKLENYRNFMTPTDISC